MNTDYKTECTNISLISRKEPAASLSVQYDTFCTLTHIYTCCNASNGPFNRCRPPAWLGKGWPFTERHVHGTNRRWMQGLIGQVWKRRRHQRISSPLKNLKDFFYALLFHSAFDASLHFQKCFMKAEEYIETNAAQVWALGTLFFAASWLRSMISHVQCFNHVTVC